MALKAWLIHMPNQNQKHSEDSQINSTTSKEPESRRPTAKVRKLNPEGLQQKVIRPVVHRGVHDYNKDSQTLKF